MISLDLDSQRRETAAKAGTTLPDMWHGWLYAGFFGLDCILIATMLQQMSSQCSRVGIRIRAAMISAVYNKAVRVEGIEAHVGDVIGLVSADAYRLYEGCTYFHYLWSGPLEALAIIILLIVLTGVSALIGLGILLLLVPFQFWLARLMTIYRRAGIAATEHRVGIMHEILLAIKMVKFYAWEESFAKKVSDIRDEELSYMKKSACVKSVNLMTVFVIPPLLALSIFSIYVFFVSGTLKSSIHHPLVFLTESAFLFVAENVLPAAVAFTTLSLFNTLRFPLVVLPRAVRTVADAWAASERLEEFLLRPEMEEMKRGKKAVIKFKKADIGYLACGTVLKNINLTIPAGSLWGVVGPVGGGKTTLVSALLGEARILSGSLKTGGSVAYVPQNPWVQHGTVRDNILFGLPYDEKRYETAVFSCALKPDLAMLPKGDQTEIGERGINVSGGQKQRIALARAVYSQADMYILDTPLSAVDQHTCSHIFTHAIKGCMKGKTVVLVTHQIELLDRCDMMSVIKKGEMRYFGKFDATVIKKEFPGWESHTVDHQQEEGSQKKKTDKVERAVVPDTSEAELRLKGKARRNAWQVWFKNAGYAASVLAAIIAVFTQSIRIVSDWFIRYWVADGLKAATERLGSRTTIPIYAGLVAAFLIFLLTRGLWFYNYALKSATVMHNQLFTKIVAAPISFFTITPLGPLLNSFSKDQDSVDSGLPDSVHITMIYALITLTTVILVCIEIPYYIIVASLLIIGFALMQWYATPAVKTVKSFVQKTNSPIFSHVSETLHGISIVRAFGATPRFLRDNLNIIDRNHKAQFNADHVNLWISFWLDLLAALLMLATVLFVVGIDTIGAAGGGLAISNSIQTFVFFSMVVRGFSDFNSEVNSVQRIDNYIRKTQSEKTDVINSLADNWPPAGKIEYKDVVLSYFPGYPPVLNGVTLTIKPGEKIGIVGRTGSGKSTLMMALFRLVELERGSVVIDGIDIGHVGLRDFRSKLAIIPQEPVMFRGTIRSNLDPFNQYSDETLWNALELSGLKKSVDRMDGKLEAKVDEGGSNFSLGQKQLFCLARAVLKDSKILVLDEATAAMDLETDGFIQKTIRKVFWDRTVLTIAHRLDTIIDSDRILVMNRGRVQEFDTVFNLLTNKESEFYQLVTEARLDVKKLREMSKDQHDRISESEVRESREARKAKKSSKPVKETEKVEMPSPKAEKKSKKKPVVESSSSTSDDESERAEKAPARKSAKSPKSKK
jgi:ATP-binding cassette, subfamily C (CFTR/MRP), member 1